ncbi:hypothetical protein ENZ75_25570, partial [Mesorhizobium sp. M7A.F.Ca.CA.002.04.1.1]
MKPNKNNDLAASGRPSASQRRHPAGILHCPVRGDEAEANGGCRMRNYGGLVHAIGGFARDGGGNFAILFGLRPPVF